MLLGRSGGTRTPNHRFWRAVLYQLSYAPSSPEALEGSRRTGNYSYGHRVSQFEYNGATRFREALCLESGACCSSPLAS